MRVFYSILVISMVLGGLLTKYELDNFPRCTCEHIVSKEVQSGR